MSFFLQPPPPPPIAIPNRLLGIAETNCQWNAAPPPPAGDLFGLYNLILQLKKRKLKERNNSNRSQMPLRTATNAVRTIFRQWKFGKTMEKQGDSYEIIVREHIFFFCPRKKFQFAPPPPPLERQGGPNPPKR